MCDAWGSILWTNSSSFVPDWAIVPNTTFMGKLVSLTNWTQKSGANNDNHLLSWGTWCRSSNLNFTDWRDTFSAANSTFSNLGISGMPKLLLTSSTERLRRRFRLKTRIFVSLPPSYGSLPRNVKFFSSERNLSFSSAWLLWPRIFRSTASSSSL